MHLLSSFGLVLISVFLWRLGVIGVCFGLEVFFFLHLDFDDLVSLETLSSPCCPPFSGFALRFLRILSHYVMELALMFSEHPCHMQDTEFDTHAHGSPMALCLRWLHTCLPDSTLYYFSFVVYAVTPLSFKEGDD